MKVGNIVINRFGERGIITKVNDGYVYVLWKDGSCNEYDKDHAKQQLYLTNRSVDILDVLVRIK